jgi:protein tyrosine phosphatase (PTP) superfamily phosphohydrolase (DUF442 family)
MRPDFISNRAWQQPCDTCVAGVVNFTKVTEKLWRGAQPDTKGFLELRKAGVRTVINLRHDHDDLLMLKNLGMHYVWLPMRAWQPNDEELVIFLSTLRRIFADPKLWPVFIHCAEGRDRTGYSIAAFRIIEEDWTADDAIQEMFDYRFNAIWFRNPDFLRQFGDQKDNIRERITVVP